MPCLGIDCRFPRGLWDVRVCMGFGVLGLHRQYFGLFLGCRDQSGGLDMAGLADSILRYALLIGISHNEQCQVRR